MKAALSREHWKVALVSLEEKVKLAEVLLTAPDGPESMLTLGATVSTVQVRVAVLLLPAASIALTWKVCDPSERGPG